MPPEVLLPLFALTLLANAILVAAAIRGMRRGQPDSDWHPRPNRPADAPGSTPGSPPLAGPNGSDPGHPLSAEMSRAIVARRMLPEATLPVPTAPGPTIAAGAVAPETAVPADTAPTAPDPGVAAAAPPPTADLDPSAGSLPTSKRRRSTKTTDTTPAATNPPPAGARPAEPRRGRRRFSLPPLDDDHERVNKSIELFLGGIDAAGDEAETTSARATSGGATTVAIVVVDGLPAGSAAAATRRGADGERARPEPAVVVDALAMVERTVRGAARGTDLVTIGERGRYQIVLASTGELAARAYLRRIRAAIEPRLEASDPPLHLTVVTATVLDEPLETAIARAEHRLSLALGVARSPGEDNEPSTPRAAAD